MSRGLPDTVDALDLIDKSRVLEGSLPLARMERLRGMLREPTGEARFRLEFRREGRVLAVRGWVAAEMELECQCCLSPLPHRIDSPFALGLVSTIDEANLLPEPFEPLLLNQEPLLRVADLIEDEILLSIPSVPRHDACEPFELSDRTADSQVSAVRKPFANLATLLPFDTTEV